MKTLGKITLAALIILIAFSCKKGDQLPKPTQTGANTMAAKINGKVWQKKACFSCIGGGSALRVDYSNGDFYIEGEQNDEVHNITIEILLLNIMNTGKYELTGRSGTPTSTSYARLSNYQNDTKYYTTANQKGTVTITKLDINNKIISGTFEFTAEDESNPANTIRVTDGRFDVKYN